MDQSVLGVEAISLVALYLRCHLQKPNRSLSQSLTLNTTTCNEVALVARSYGLPSVGETGDGSYYGGTPRFKQISGMIDEAFDSWLAKLFAYSLGPSGE